MGCSVVLTGVTLDCRDNVGGIKTVHIMEVGGGIGFTLEGGGSDFIDSVSGTQADVFELELRRESGSYVETINNSLENSSLFFTQELTISISKLDSVKRAALKQIAKGRVQVIFTDANNTPWLIGYEYGAVMTGSAMTGTALGDKSGYELVFTAKEKMPANAVSTAWYDDLTP